MNQRGLTPLTLWALAFGCCIGWGSFIMPGTTFLPNAGTAGTTIAILLGALVMILIAYNYHFVMHMGDNEAVTKRLHGVHEQIAGDRLHDVLHELGSVAFQPVPLFRSIHPI